MFATSVGIDGLVKRYIRRLVSADDAFHLLVHDFGCHGIRADIIVGILIPAVVHLSVCYDGLEPVIRIERCAACSHGLTALKLFLYTVSFMVRLFQPQSSLMTFRYAATQGNHDIRH
jgi:hypothetical protein